MNVCRWVWDKGRQVLQSEGKSLPEDLEPTSLGLQPCSRGKPLFLVAPPPLPPPPRGSGRSWLDWGPRES